MSTPVRLIVAGVVATTAMTVFMHNAHKIGLPKVNIPGVLAADAHNGEDAQPREKLWWGGLALHYLLGVIVFPFSYAYGGKQLMPGKSDLQKSTAWGAGLWAISETVIMPLLNRGPEFKKPSVAKSYGLAHLIYAWTFGFISAK